TTVETQQFSPFGTAAPIPVKGNALPYPTGAIRQHDRDADAYSIYGQLTINMSDSFRAILDLRYTDEDQDSNASTRNVAWQTLDNWETPTRDLTRTAGEYAFTQNRSDDSFDPSLRLQYNISDDAMVYAVYARGSKAGGTKANDGALAGVMAGIIAAEGDAWAQRFTGLPAATLTPAFIGTNVINFQQGNTVFDFEDEEAESYEVGIKSTLADGAVYLNASLFTTEYKNLQTSSYNGTNFVIGNAGQATIDGFEVDLSWQASEGLRLNAALSYVDGEYDSYVGASCVIDENLLALNEDCSTGIGNRGDRSLEDQAGEPLERSPDLEFNFSALWDKKIGDNLMMKVAGSVYHSGDYFIQPTQEPYSQQSAYTKYDLRVALAAADESWEVAINGRNLGDEQVISHAYRVFSRFNTLTKGRTVSLEGTLRF
ncbi:MAG: TonB-dependent receptor, partial [Pseudomonadales bacterium]